MDTNVVCLPLHYGLVVLLCVTEIFALSANVEQLQFCSFFNNRGPKPQSNLRNCTWFGTNSCCMQEEIDAEFSTMKPIPGASLACQRYTNYFMCYICAPYQNTFYSRERLTVCEEFCDVWFEACRTAIMKGTVIGSLFSNGKEFCRSRSYEVMPLASQKCYMYDPQMKSSSGRIYPCSVLIVFIVLLSVIPWMLKLVLIR